MKQSNVEKCKMCYIPRKLQPVKYPYQLVPAILARCIETKDLGFWFNDKLKFTYHITKTISATEILGSNMMNCRDFTNPVLLKSAYLLLV